MESTRSSQSPPPASEEQSVQILVKNISGETTTLTVPPSTSIATIKSLLLNHPTSSSASNGLPMSSQSLRLTHAGRHLSPESMLSDHNLPAQSVLSLTYPLLGGAEETAATASQSSSDIQMTGTKATSESATAATSKIESPAKPASATPKRRKFPRCGFKSCTSPVQRIVGDCGFCGGKFCGQHRLLESHACSGLEECREEEKRRNGERLGRERTVVVRGV